MILNKSSGTSLEVLENNEYSSFRVPKDSSAEAAYEKAFESGDIIQAFVYDTRERSKASFKVEFTVYQESSSISIKSRIYTFTDPELEDVKCAEGIAKRLFDMF